MSLGAYVTDRRSVQAGPAAALMARRVAADAMRRDIAGNPLDILRRRLTRAIPSAAFAAGDDGQRTALLAMALKHVEALGEQGFAALPWRVGLFGCAYVTIRKQAYLHPGTCGRVKFLDLDSGRRETPAAPPMHYGASIDPDADIATGEQGALLVYDSGACLFIPPRHGGVVRALGEPWAQPRRLDAAG